MCSSEIARVRAGEQTIWKRHRVCVWERGVRARERASDGERERERERERKRGGERGRLCP